MANRWGNNGNSERLYFLGFQNQCRWLLQPWKHLLTLALLKTNLDSILKSRDITLLTKIHLVKAVFFPLVMYGCESWTIKKAENQRTGAFEPWCCRRLLRVSWTAKRSNPSNPKGNQSWIFIGRTDAEGESALLWLPDAKSQFIGKDPDSGQDWRQKEKGMTENKMVWWHHRLSGHEFD